MNDTVRRMLMDYIEALDKFHPIKAKNILRQIKQWMEINDESSESRPTSA